MPKMLNIFALGNQAKSSNITAAKRLNLYYDIQSGPDKASVVAYGTPGLDLFASVSSSFTRGMHWMESNSTLYVVQRGDLYSVTSAGVKTLLKSLTTFHAGDISSRVRMADNGTQIVIVTGAYGYLYVPGTNTLTDITASLPSGGSDFVTFLDSYFIVNRIGTGQFYLSDSYKGETWNGLNFATAESSPDNLQAVIADKGYLVLLGTSSVEVWVNTGNLAFTFQRINGAPAQYGLVSKTSLSRCGESLIGLFRNRYGSLCVATLEGYNVTPVSNADIDYLINKYSTPSDAVGFGYTLNGRHFYQITFVEEGITWLFDRLSGAWSQLKSYGLTRHRADLCTAAFNNKLVVSDYSNGRLYHLSADAYTDNGDIIERELIGGHAFTQSRNLSMIRRLRVDMEGGVGTAAIDPVAVLTISRDGGHTWGAELWSTIGGIGQFAKRAEWRRLGIARDWVFKLRITDPVKVVIIAAIIELEELNK